MVGKEYYKDMEKSEIVVAKYLNDMGFDWDSLRGDLVE